MKTTFTIDRSKWRCGEYGPYMRGLGHTSLHNDKGFQCCLGQIASQLGLTESELYGVSYPEELYAEEQEKLVGILICSEADGEDNDSLWKNQTKFATEAVLINDNKDLNDIQRERALERLAEEYGLRIEFVGEY